MLIGTPRPAATGDDQIERILTQLRQRQIADEQVGTYERQKIAAQKERELREAEAFAKQQAAIRRSGRRRFLRRDKMRCWARWPRSGG